MEEGLTVVLSGKELQGCWQRRIEIHQARLTELKQRRQTIKEGPTPKPDDYPTAEDIESQIDYQKRLIEHCQFMADHVQETQLYRLSEREVAMARIGISQRLPG